MRADRKLHAPMTANAAQVKSVVTPIVSLQNAHRPPTDARVLGSAGKAVATNRPRVYPMPIAIQVAPATSSSAEAHAVPMENVQERSAAAVRVGAKKMNSAAMTMDVWVLEYAKA